MAKARVIGAIWLACLLLVTGCCWERTRRTVSNTCSYAPTATPEACCRSNDERAVLPDPGCPRR